MIPVYICDKNITWLNIVKKSIESFAFRENIDMKIAYSSTDPDDIFDFIFSQTTKNCVYFLDVDLKMKNNGIALAKKIRDIDPRGFIIFVTVHDNIANMIFKYKIEALDYIIKDETDKKGRIRKQIYSCLKHIMDLYHNPQYPIPGTIKIKSYGANHILSFNEINYIEILKGSHKLRIHLKEGVLDASGSLNNIQEKLNDDFFRCHNAYIVNIKNIKKIVYTNREVQFDNRLYCPCSIRKLSELQRICDKSHTNR